MTMTKASTLRSDLGYTDADLAELKNVVCNGDQAADLPPFPRPADYTARRAIYQFLQKHGKYAPMFAWCRSKEIWRQSEETPLCGKRTSELYADDTEAKIRHWELANTQEQFYNAMLAIEAYIVRDISETWCRVKDERKGFDKQLKSLSTTIRGGEWGATPPSEVIDIMPPDPTGEILNKVKGVPQLVEEARNDDAKAIGHADAYLAKLNLEPNQQEVLKLYRQGLNQVQIAREMDCCKRTVSRLAQAANEAFTKMGRPAPIVWNNKKSREEIALKADL